MLGLYEETDYLDSSNTKYFRQLLDISNTNYFSQLLDSSNTSYIKQLLDSSNTSYCRQLLDSSNTNYFRQLLNISNTNCLSQLLDSSNTSYFKQLLGSSNTRYFRQLLDSSNKKLEEKQNFLNSTIVLFCLYFIVLELQLKGRKRSKMHTVGLCRYFVSDRVILVTNITVNIHFGSFRYSTATVLTSITNWNINFNPAYYS